MLQQQLTIAHATIEVLVIALANSDSHETSSSSTSSKSTVRSPAAQKCIELLRSADWPLPASLRDDPASELADVDSCNSWVLIRHPPLIDGCVSRVTFYPSVSLALYLCLSLSYVRFIGNTLSPICLCSRLLQLLFIADCYFLYPTPYYLPLILHLHSMTQMMMSMLTLMMIMMSFNFHLPNRVWVLLLLFNDVASGATHAGEELVNTGVFNCAFRFFLSSCILLYWSLLFLITRYFLHFASIILMHLSYKVWFGC